MMISLRYSLRACALSALALVGLSAASNGLSSPVGPWKTIDEKTGRTRSVARVYEQEGELFARVEQNLTSGDGARACTKSTGDRKDQPLIGLVFMRNMKLVDGEYRGGRRSVDRKSAISPDCPGTRSTPKVPPINAIVCLLRV